MGTQRNEQLIYTQEMGNSFQEVEFRPNLKHKEGFNQTDNGRKEQTQKIKEPGKFNQDGAQNPLWVLQWEKAI